MSSGLAPDRIFDWLARDWTFIRRITPLASMSGRARFLAGPDACLQYSETGLLRLTDGQSFDAERRYIFMRAPQGFRVYFAETPLRLFHEIRFSPWGQGWRGEAVHLCGSDRYESRYRVLNGGFVTAHRVTGPRKNYAVVTRYIAQVSPSRLQEGDKAFPTCTSFASVVK